MTNDQREIHQKQRILEYADRIGNIDKTCRYFGVARSTFYVWRDRYREFGDEADRDPKLLEFSPDLLGAPAVLICESTNEGLRLSRNGRSSRSALRDRSPVGPETLAMPADHGFGLNND